MLERLNPAQSVEGHSPVDWMHMRLADECGQLTRQCQQAQALFGHADLVAMRGAQAFADMTALLRQATGECGPWH